MDYFSQAIACGLNEFFERATSGEVVIDIFDIDILAEVLPALPANGESFGEVSSDERDAVLEEELSAFSLEVLPWLIGVEADKDELSFVAVSLADVDEVFFLLAGEFSGNGAPSVSAEGEDIEHAFTDDEVVEPDVMGVEFDDLP